MFTARWRLFRLLGIPISLDASWLIIFALLTLSLTNEFPAIFHVNFPQAAPPSPYAYGLMGLITTLAFFACILLHELGHAVVARARGMPIRGITLFLFGGVAELGAEPPSASTELLMAIAGPAVSVVLALVFWSLALAGYQLDWPHPIVIVLGYLGLINTMVLAFNLIPAFPLDGGRVLRAILWGATGHLRQATYWATLAGQGFAWLLICFGIWQFFSENWLGGVWLGLIGMYLNNAAQGSYQQVIVRQALQGEPVRRFMNANPIVAPPSIDLLHWVEDYVYHYHHRSFPVASNGKLEGIITTHALSGIPRQEWSKHTVGEVMLSDLQMVTIGADADALEALGKMQRNGTSRLLVTDDGRLLGIVSLKDLLRFLDLKLELEDAGERNEPEA